MALTTNDVYADVLAQLNSLDATTVTVLQTAYAEARAGTIADSLMNSTDWATGQIKAAILDTEYEIASEICFNQRHPERGAFVQQSAGLGSGAFVPIYASDLTTPYLGIFDYAKEATSGQLLTLRPFATVKAGLQIISSGATVNYRAVTWCIAGGVIFHTSTDSIRLYGPALAGPVYASFGATLRVKDHHKQAIVAGALAKLLTKEGQWQEAYADNLTAYNAHVAGIRAVGQQLATPLPK